MRAPPEDPALSAAVWGLVLEIQGMRRDLGQLLGALGSIPEGTRHTERASAPEPGPSVSPEEFLLLLSVLEDHLLPDLRKLMFKRQRSLE